MKLSHNTLQAVLTIATGASEPRYYDLDLDMAQHNIGYLIPSNDAPTIIEAPDQGEQLAAVIYNIRAMSRAVATMSADGNWFVKIWSSAEGIHIQSCSHCYGLGEATRTAKQRGNAFIYDIAADYAVASGN